MKQYCAYLFDLDGTLIDSKPGIINSLTFALRHFGISETDDIKLTSFIGPPIHVTLATIYGFDEAQSAEAIRIYRERYAEKGIHECTLYPNVRRTLNTLKDNGHTICLATSKPGRFAKEIIANFKIDAYFDFVQGGDLDGITIDKKETIKICMDFGGLDKQNTLMVGDRKFDVLGAKANGIDCAGVLCGYGGEKELFDTGAKYIIPDISALID